MIVYRALDMGRAEEAVLKLNAAAEFPEYSSAALKLLKRAEAERKLIYAGTFRLAGAFLQFPVHPAEITGASS